MPLLGTLSGFFEDEYRRFMRGLEVLSRTDQERLFTEMRRNPANPQQPLLVTIPGWEDIVHVSPRTPATREQFDEWRRARALGVDPRLDPSTRKELDRRAAVREAMQRSAQPEFDRAWGSVMTAVDNVQDFLGAVAVFGRIALSIAGRLGLVTMPGLGLVLGAAGMLSFAMLLGQVAFPLFLAYCAGPRAALRAGAGTALTAGFFKGASSFAAHTAARGLDFRHVTPSRVKAISGVIGAALVVAQTTDQLFGVGLSLGPVVGAIMGAVYGAEAASRGLEVEVRRGPSVPHIKPRVQARLLELPTPALVDRLIAAELLASAPLVLADTSPATHQDRRDYLAALLPAIGTLTRDFAGTGWQEDVHRLADWRVPPPPPPFRRPSWYDLEPPGRPVPALEWPSSWGGATWDTPLALQVVPGAIARGVTLAYEDARDTVEQPFIGALVNDITEALWLLYEDDPAALKSGLSLEYTVLERMAYARVWPHPGTELERAERVWQEAVELVRDRKQALKTSDEWQALFDRHQVDYIRAIAPPGGPGGPGIPA